MAVRIIAAGDSFITRRLPEKGYEGFEELAGLIRVHLSVARGNACGHKRRHLGDVAAGNLGRHPALWV